MVFALFCGEKETEMREAWNVQRRCSSVWEAKDRLGATVTPGFEPLVEEGLLIRIGIQGNQKKKKTKQKKNSYLSRGAKDYVENKELKKQDNYCSVLLS